MIRNGARKDSVIADDSATGRVGLDDALDELRTAMGR